jgi:myosin I
MSLQKDDEVELVEKDDNGWWLVRKGGVEGWAPNNYLELVPAKPPPPPRRPAAPPSSKPLVNSTQTIPAVVLSSANTDNGSATPWKKTQVASNVSTSPYPPSSSQSSKPSGPPIATKPKQVVAAKPSAPKVPSKPTTTRPDAAPAPAPRYALKPASAVGQLDLSAAVSHFVQQLSTEC